MTMKTTHKQNLMTTALVGALVLLGVAAPAPACAGRRAADKPNFVFILADNLGYGEIGCYGGGLTRGAATPRIDKLASEG